MIQKLLRTFIRTWKQHTTMQVATLTVLAATYTVVTLSFLIHQNLEMILTRWGNEVELSVYLDDKVEENEISKIEKTLRSSELFTQVNYISKDQAVERFKKQMVGYVPSLLTDTEFGNPLPASLETKIHQGVSSGSDFDELTDFVKKIENFSGVDEVSYGQGWIENYASVVQSFSFTSYFLIFVLLAGSLFVVGNSIRNSISQRRDEIEVLELVGATKSLIRLPYIVEGIIMGLLASLLAIIICSLLFHWQTHYLGSKLSFWSFTSEIQSLSLTRSILVILMGGVFGAFGSYLCVSRLSTGWTAAQNSESFSET